MDNFIPLITIIAITLIAMLTVTNQLSGAQVVPVPKPVVGMRSRQVPYTQPGMLDPNEAGLRARYVCQELGMDNPYNIQDCCANQARVECDHDSYCAAKASGVCIGNSPSTNKRISLGH